MLAAISPHLSVLDELSDHLEVVWGALVAFGVVVLLTPAVGGMARRLGVVDAPGGRRVNQLPVPRLGGLALFLGILVPALAFLHLGHQTRGLLLGAAIAVSVGIVDDFRGLPWYAKLGGQVAAAAVLTGFGVWGLVNVLERDLRHADGRVVAAGQGEVHDAARAQQLLCRGKRVIR